MVSSYTVGKIEIRSGRIATLFNIIFEETCILDNQMTSLTEIPFKESDKKYDYVTIT